MKRWIAIMIYILLVKQSVMAQICDSNFFSILYNAKAKITFTKAVTTPQNGTITVGNLFYPRGWITKMTNQGSLIWSNGYNADYKSNNQETFNTPEFIDASQSSASSYIIGGSIIRDWNDIINDVKTPPPVTVALVSNVDQSGNVLWSREIISAYSVNKAGPAMWCTNVLKLKNGDILAYLAVDKFLSENEHSYGKLVCLSSYGTVKWKRTLNTGDYEVSGLARYIQRAMTQIKNGNVIIADGVCDRNFNYLDSVVYKSWAMHLFSIDPLNGNIVWETSYSYPPDRQSALTGFKNITELPNGNLSFITELGTSDNGNLPYVYGPTNIITDARGQLIKTIAYNIPQGSCILDNVSTDDTTSGTRTLLLTNQYDNSAVLTHINAAGNIEWTKGYGNVSQKYPPACFNHTKTGYNIFFSDYGFNSYQAQIIITDAAGNADCANTDVIVEGREQLWSYSSDQIQTNNYDDYDQFVVNPFAVSPKIISIDKVVDCQKFVPCCTDYIDTVPVKTVSICEGENYLLPDNRSVTKTGHYDVSFTTEYGCDSTYFINVESYKKPSDLQAINDTCLEERDSITINATKGFDTYKWMNINSEDPSYRVYAEGTYRLNVSNYCGSKTDTFQVYKKCDYPIYMPTAFTPNNDQLNDMFRVPEQNKNRLVYLKIYNRFEQLIFTSTDKKKGWDGAINRFPQTAGAYIYKVEMMGLTHKRVSQSGLFTLIR